MFSSILSAVHLSSFPRLCHWSPSHFPIKISLLIFFCFSFMSLVSILLFPFLGTPTAWSLYTFLIYNLMRFMTFCLLVNLITVFSFSTLSETFISFIHLSRCCQTLSRLWILSYAYTDGTGKCSCWNLNQGQHIAFSLNADFNQLCVAHS